MQVKQHKGKMHGQVQCNAKQSNIGKAGKVSKARRFDIQTFQHHHTTSILYHTITKQIDYYHLRMYLCDRRLFQTMSLDIDIAMAMTMDVAMIMGIRIAIKYGDHSVA